MGTSSELAKIVTQVKKELLCNWKVYSIVIPLLFLTIVSLPFEQVNLIAISSDATFIFDQPAQHTFSNGTTIPLTLFRGAITLTGKGGLSADNSLSVSLTVYFNKQYGFNPDEPNAVLLTLQSAYFDPPMKDDFGFPQWANLSLTKQQSTLPYWDMWGTSENVGIRYDQGGTYGGNLILDGNSTHAGNYTLPPYIRIGNDDVTVSAKTNQLLISLTWAILLLGVVEFRNKNDGNHAENKTPNNQSSQNNTK